MDKLKEYEATGLTPHQIERMKARLPLRCWTDETTDKISIFNVSVDRLIELAKADRENKIVILPCAIGDTVYYLYEHEDEIFTGKCKSCDTDYNEYDMCWHSKYEWRIMPYKVNKTFLYLHGQEFGKTVFLTIEEAENAINEKNCKVKNYG